MALEISTANKNEVFQVQQDKNSSCSEDSKTVSIPKRIQEINSPSPSNTNSAENVSTPVSNSQDPLEDLGRLDPQGAHADPFKWLSMTATEWVNGWQNVEKLAGSKSAEMGSADDGSTEVGSANDEYSQPNIHFVHRTHLQVQKENIQDYFRNAISEMKKLPRDYSSFEDYLNDVKKLVLVSSEIELKIQNLKGYLEKELQTLKDGGIPKEIVEEYEKLIKTEIQDVREITTERVSNAIEKAFTHFYINTLDAYPKLHPHLDEFVFEKQLCYLSTDIEEFLKQNSVQDKHKMVLSNCVCKLQQALSIAVCDSSAGSRKASEKMKKAIDNLKEGESLIFPGSSKASIGEGGHAFLYEIIREPEGRFTFTIINTGDDEKEHRDRKPLASKVSTWFGSNSRKYAHKSYLVPASALDANFLETITPSETENIRTPQLIKQLHQSLSSKKEVKSQFGRLHNPQKRQSCPAKAPASWLKGELSRHFNEQDANALYLQFKLFRAENNYKRLEELKNNVPPEQLAKIYSRPNTEKGDFKEKSNVPQKRPATKKELADDFNLLDKAVKDTFSKWEKKLGNMKKS